MFLLTYIPLRTFNKCLCSVLYPLVYVYDSAVSLLCQGLLQWMVKFYSTCSILLLGSVTTRLSPRFIVCLLWTSVNEAEISFLLFIALFVVL